jgi:hypothetical protein
MDDYTYTTFGANGWLRYDGLHRPGFPTLFQDVLYHFSHTRTPAYRGHLYPDFGRGRCEVHVDVPAHPSDPGMTVWFTTATGDDLDDTLDRATHQTLMEFYEHHMSSLASIAIACPLFRTRATWRGASAWPLWVTLSVRHTTWGGHSRHAMPST